MTKIDPTPLIAEAQARETALREQIAELRRDLNATRETARFWERRFFEERQARALKTVLA